MARLLEEKDCSVTLITTCRLSALVGAHKRWTLREPIFKKRSHENAKRRGNLESSSNG